MLHWFIAIFCISQYGLYGPKARNCDLGIWSQAIYNIDLIDLQKLITTLTKDYNCMLLRSNFDVTKSAKSNNIARMI